MKLSTRNVFKGKVVRVTRGAVNAEVVLEVAPGVRVVSVITPASPHRLGLAKGSEAYSSKRAT